MGGASARRSSATRIRDIRLRIYTLCRMLRRMRSNAVLEAIAEPTRRRILDAVREGERSVGDLVEIVGMHQPGVSRHLKVLRDAGLVEARPDAQRRLYRLRPEPLQELDAWLEPYREQFSAHLDALERHLERTATPVKDNRTTKEQR
jgi:DNA-binding transcriptional ArsR family regulator